MSGFQFYCHLSILSTISNDKKVIYFPLGNKLPRETAYFFLLLDKITNLIESANLFLQRNQIDRAVESFKSALQLAKQADPVQPSVVHILSNIGSAVHQAGMLDESLEYFQEAKEILDNHIEVEYLHFNVLNNMGASYLKLGKFPLAFQFYKDALDSLDMTLISGKVYSALCKSLTKIMMKLTLVSLRKIAVEKNEKKLPTDDIRHSFNELYELSWLCIVREEQDEVLECLEKAREIAKRFDYKCGRMVLVLLLLSMTYGEMGSFDISRSCYKEAKEMAKSVPREDDSILPGELGMIESMKKERYKRPNINR